MGQRATKTHAAGEGWRPLLEHNRARHRSRTRKRGYHHWSKETAMFDNFLSLSINAERVMRAALIGVQLAALMVIVIDIKVMG